MQPNNTEFHTPMPSVVEEDTARFLAREELSTTPPVPADTLPYTVGKSTHRFVALLSRILPFLPLLALLGGCTSALTFLRSFDADIGHIRTGSVWFLLTCLFWGAGLVLTILLLPYARRTRQFRPYATRTGETFFGLFTGVLLGFYAIRTLYTVFTTAPDPSAIVDTTSLSRLSGIFLLLAALYFVCIAVGKSPMGSRLLSLCACVGVILVLFREYFDFTLPLNSPIRHLSTLAWGAFLLFLLSEARVAVDLWYTCVPFTVFSAAAALLFTGGYGLCSLILSFTETPTLSLIGACAFLGVAGLAFFRLKQLSTLLGDHVPPPPTQDEIKKYAKKHGISLPKAQNDAKDTDTAEPHNDPANADIDVTTMDVNTMDVNTMDASDTEADN